LAERIAVISTVGFGAVMFAYFDVRFFQQLIHIACLPPSGLELLKKHIINSLEFAPGGIMVVFDFEGRIIPMTVPAQGK